MSTDKVLEARKAHASLRKRLNKQILAAGFIWNDESEHEIAGVTSIKEAIRAFKRAPRGYPAKEMALRKWVDLCTNLDEICHVYTWTRRGFLMFWYGTNEFEDDDESGYGATKWIQLATTIIASAQIFHELIWPLRYQCPWKCRAAAAARAIELSTESRHISEISEAFHSSYSINDLDRRARELYEFEQNR